MIPRKARRGHVFGIPIILAITTIAGLVVGLLGDDVYDVAAAVTLTIPVAVMAWSIAKARRGDWDHRPG